jgi:hypothetical protein
MQATVTNTSGHSINYLDTTSYPAGVGVGAGGAASGGARCYPLPYPFAWIGTLANSGSKQLPMGPSDLYQPDGAVNCLTFQTWQQWQQLVQAGIVTIAFAQETNPAAVDEIAIGVI